MTEISVSVGLALLLFMCFGFAIGLGLGWMFRGQHEEARLERIARQRARWTRSQEGAR